LATKSIVGDHQSHLAELKDGKALSKGIEYNMSAHEYIYYVLEFDLNNLNVLTEE
jgi:hypothetical protein